MTVSGCATGLWNGAGEFRTSFCGVGIHLARWFGGAGVECGRSTAAELGGGFGVSIGVPQLAGVQGVSSRRFCGNNCLGVGDAAVVMGVDKLYGSTADFTDHLAMPARGCVPALLSHPPIRCPSSSHSTKIPTAITHEY